MRRALFSFTALILLIGLASHLALAAQPIETPDAWEGHRGETPCAAPTELSLTGRWLEVSLSEHVVRLCEGPRPWREYLAATGIGDSPETTTFPGLFTIHEKNVGPFPLPEYGVYVSHWVGFDAESDNGFHSMPMDASGRVLDDRLGEAISHGCVRTAHPSEIFQFAEFGMKVWVH